MAYVPSWENDVFVSYATVDDQPLPGASDGWVTVLVDSLKLLLAQQLGRSDSATIWRDLRLRGNEPLTDEIMTAAGSSALLLVVLSEGYLASEWCKRERNRFLELVGAGSRRLFVVERTPIERSRRPVELQDLLGYPFWVRKRAELPPRTLGFPAPTPGDSEYYERVTKLAIEIADELKLLRSKATA
jgi:hypothetical protein